MIWWTKSWNPIVGCTKCSPACDNCYAERLHTQRHKALLAGRRMPECYAQPFGTVRFLPERLSDPLHWRKPQRVFLCNMSDLFHKDVQDAWRDQAFAVMALCPQHEFLVLTKRWERMTAYLAYLAPNGQPDPERWDAARRPLYDAYMAKARKLFRFNSNSPAGVRALRTAEVIGHNGAYKKLPLPNVLHGATVWDQASMDEAAQHLLKMPEGARLFLSIEPMLGPVVIPAELLARISWVVTGGETGPGARPVHPDWPRSLRDQCVAAGVPFFFKQWGEWAPHLPELGYDNPATGGRAWGCINRDGEWMPGTTPFNGDRGDYEWPMVRVGQRRAGRKLDGRTWEEVPHA